MKVFRILVACSLLIFISACESNHATDGAAKDSENSLSIDENYAPLKAQILTPIENDEVVMLEKDGIKLSEIKTPTNQNATLVLNTTKFKPGENLLNFAVSEIKNFNLAYLTNNYELNQFNSTDFNVELMHGNNVFLAFLMNEKKISIKTEQASVLKNVVLGGGESMFNMEQPHLFYLLPHSTIDPTVLDFFLLNTSIAKDGNKLKATINDVEFIIEKWAAYKISGLKKAENTMRIQLLDKNNELIEGPFNDSGERKFNLSPTVES